VVNLNLAIMFLVLAVVWPLFFEWLRHRPYNLPRSTQHLVFAGLLGASLFLSAAAFFMVGYVESPSYILAHHLSARYVEGRRDVGLIVAVGAATWMVGGCWRFFSEFFIETAVGRRKPIVVSVARIGLVAIVVGGLLSFVAELERLVPVGVLNAKTGRVNERNASETDY
jgi:hypothetical protein